MILLNGDMVITIPKEEKEQQLRHLDSLEPADKAQYDEITELFNIVNQSENNCKPNCKPKGMDKLSTPPKPTHLKLVKG